MNLPLVTPSLLVAAGAAPANAALYAPHLAASCAKRGVVTPSDTANLLAEIMNESGNLSAVHECMTYTTAGRIRSVFPSHFRNTASALPYVRQPKKLGDLVYGKMGGYDDRGAGLAEVTGVDNFRLYAEAAGKPLTQIESYMITPEGAADSAVWYVVRFGCLGLADPLEWRRRVAGVAAPEIPIGWPNVSRLYALLARALGVTHPIATPRPASGPQPGADGLMAAEQAGTLSLAGDAA